MNSYLVTSKRAARLTGLLAVMFHLGGAASFAGFSGADIFLPSVGARPGVPPAVWYTTIWVHNPNPSAANVTFYLLERKANPAPLTYTDTIPAGDTRRYDNAVKTLFNREVFGAIRVTASAKVVVGSRIYSATGPLDESSGQFFAGVPASFAIGAGQSTELLGVWQTLPADNSDFRYNFGFVETTGTGTCTVQVQARDHTGATLGTKSYTLREWEQMQKQFREEFPGVSTDNARLTVTVTGGSGRVIAFGSQVANASQDPSTFEMAFRDDLLAENSSGGGSITGVTAGAGLTGGGSSGNVTLAVVNAGIVSGMLANSSVTKAKLAAGGGASGQVLGTDGANLVWQDAGSGGGITGVTAGAGLTGGGSSGNVTVAVATGGISNAMLAANSVDSSKIVDGSVDTADLANASVTTTKISTAGGSNGQVLTISGSAATWQSAAGFALPYAGSTSSASAGLSVVNNGAGSGLSGDSPDNVGVVGTSSNGRGLHGMGGTGGVSGMSVGGYGVQGSSTSGVGVAGYSGSSFAVHGSATGASGKGIFGVHTASGNFGEIGSADYGARGRHENSSSWGYLGTGNKGAGGFSSSGIGVEGSSGTSIGVRGEAASGSAGRGVFGVHNSSGNFGELGSADYGARGRHESTGSIGYLGGQNTGSYGYTSSGGSAGIGVHGVTDSHNGTGVKGVANNGTAAYAIWGISSTGYAGFFNGNTHVTGTLTAGSKSFMIDHPLDPENKVLYHVSVESPDMMNIYNGNAVTDEEGRAVIELPQWFEALNRDFRYQLTVIGRFAQAIVEEEIADNRFTIRTNLSHVKVSWQVTGIRHDPWADANRTPVEADKAVDERGTYLHPEAWGQPFERGRDARLKGIQD